MTASPTISPTFISMLKSLLCNPRRSRTRYSHNGCGVNRCLMRPNLNAFYQTRFVVYSVQYAGLLRIQQKRNSPKQFHGMLIPSAKERPGQKTPMAEDGIIGEVKEIPDPYSLFRRVEQHGVKSRRIHLFMKQQVKSFSCDQVQNFIPK